MESIEENLSEARDIIEDGKLETHESIFNEDIDNPSSDEELDEDSDRSKFEFVEKDEENKSEVRLNSYSDKKRNVSRNQSNNLKQKLHSLKRALKEEKVHQDALTNRLEILEADIESLKNSAVNQDRLESLESEVEDITKKHRSLAEKMVEYDQVSVEKKLKDLETKQEDLREALRILADEELENGHLEDTVRENQQNLNEQVAKIRKDVDETQETVVYLLNNLNELSDVIKTHLKEKEADSTPLNQHRAG